MTLEQQIAEVAREVALRRGVYPKWIEQGRLTKEKADKQSAAMEAALETLKTLRDSLEKIMKS
jgi:hypothetical protein